MATKPKKKAAKKSAMKAAKKSAMKAASKPTIASVLPGSKFELLQKQRELRVAMKGKSIAERAKMRKSL